MTNLALKLIEGTKEDRDKYINRVDVLDKVKELVTLPNTEHMTTTQVANYFEVSKPTIDQIVSRHKNEFLEDGVKTLKGEELRQYKISTRLHLVSEYKRVPSLSVFPRRAVLRVAMLLTCSKVAEKIRDYLLNVEEQATQEQKQAALKFEGQWTDKLDQYVFDEVVKHINNSVSLRNAFKEVANKIGTTQGKVYRRWYFNVSGRPPLRNRLDQETLKEINQQNHLKHHENTITEQDLTYIKEILMSLIESNNKLHSDMGKLWRAFQEVLEQQKEIKDDINSINETVDKLSNYIDTKVNEEINVLKNRVTALNKKIKLKEQENDELLKFIGKSSVLSKAFMDKEKESIKLRIDKFGNVEKI
jgi:hypothetical protein